MGCQVKKQSGGARKHNEAHGRSPQILKLQRWRLAFETVLGASNAFLTADELVV